MTPPTLIALMMATVALAGCSALEDEEPVPPELSWAPSDESLTITDVFRDTNWKWLRFHIDEGPCDAQLNGKPLVDGQLAAKDQPILVGDVVSWTDPCEARFVYVEPTAEGEYVALQIKQSYT